MTQPQTTHLTRLQRLGTILVSGADARTFLQGQLTADLDQLTPMQVMLAACNSAQGRVQAIVWLLHRSDAIALVLPAALVEITIARLRKYVLRSRVQIEDSRDRLCVYAIDGASLPAAISLQHARAHAERNGVSYVNWPAPPGAERFAMIAPPAIASTPDAPGELRWHLDDIRTGLPQVYAQTHEAFVAQMLNVDLLGGISFEKGCYTGQEIIARTHYRGAVKRRMFRFAAACPPPSPGARIISGEQHAGDVVDAAPTQQGCELLAVVNLGMADGVLSIDGSNGVKLERRELPYLVANDESLDSH